MSYGTMSSELLGVVPKLPLPLAKKFVNRSWQWVRRKNLWSFQLYEGPQFITPPLISAGTVTVATGSATVTADAIATAAITAGITSYSTIPQRQFRVRGQTIYNIVSWDDGTSTLTLDRVYGEQSNTDVVYQIFQSYYAAPYQDHLMFISVRNIPTFTDLLLDKTREQLDLMDPMRTWYGIPTDCVFYRLDTIPTSATYQYPMYELWGVPQYFSNYQLYGIRKMPDFSDLADELPPQVGEDLILERAKYYAYEWAEGHKDTMSKGGPDFKFLMGGAAKEADNLFRDYRRYDREIVDNWFVVRRFSAYGNIFMYYNSLAGRAYPGL